jgi:malonyl-CoA O-methyltransferase
MGAADGSLMGFVELVKTGAVVAAFDAAAPTYAAAAKVQAEAAEALLRRAAAPPPRRALDIGAGAGAVATRIARRWPQAEIDALDASPAMLAELSKALPEARLICADAAAFEASARYDLIFSSMALHWLADPRAALTRWRRALAPGGALHVALPVAGSLGEWRDACAEAGAADGLWRFPPEDFAQGLAAATELRAHRAEYADARAFLSSLKRTGAHSPRAGHAPLAPARLRRILERGPRPFVATFRVLYLTIVCGD